MKDVFKDEVNNSVKGTREDRVEIGVQPFSYSRTCISAGDVHSAQEEDDGRATAQFVSKGQTSIQTGKKVWHDPKLKRRNIIFAFNRAVLREISVTRTWP